MTGVLTERGNLDTDTHTRRTPWKTGDKPRHEQREHQKLRKRPGTHPFLEPIALRASMALQTPQSRLPASRTMTEQMSYC